MGPYPCTYTESSYTVADDSPIEIQWKNSAKTIFSETVHYYDPENEDNLIAGSITFTKQG
jgi:hypothetical protein